MSDVHPFDTAICLTQIEPGVWQGMPSAAYANMVGSFGGVTTATVLNAVMSDDRRTGDPVSMTINLCSAMGPGAFVITSKLQRTGKYIQHWSLEVSQDGAVCATASVICGARSDVFSHQPVDRPVVPRAEDCAVFPNANFLKWLEHYEFRFADGAPSWTGEGHAEPKSPKSAVWVGDNPPRKLDYLSLAALADSFFLRLLHVRGTMEPMGSVSITTHFLATPDELTDQGNQPVLGTADSTRMHANFHDQQVQLWSTDGKILATGTQLVWYRQ